MQLITIMDKTKLVKGAMWFSAFSISVIFAAVSLFIGFNNERHGDYTVLVIGILLIPVVFYCIYRGIKLVLEAIFE